MRRLVAWISNSPSVSRLNANSRVKEAAWKWILFYTSEEAQRLLGEWKRGIPSMRRIAEEPGGVFLNPDLPTAE
jgi:ABC-type glycerol-3-phosphate transport system substrate-binding protein